MATTKTFSFRNSKDKVIGLYLGSRTIYDGPNQVVDPIEGVIKINDPSTLEGKVLYARVTCDYIFEDQDWEIHRETLYEKVLTLHPSASEECQPNGAQRALIKKIGDKCFPFVVTLPSNSPASVILKPEMYYEGHQIGISWTVSAYLMSGSLGQKTSVVNLPFQKINFCPAARDMPAPTAEGTKSFMFDSSRPLRLRASLEKDVFMHGEPIVVKVDIENMSKKEVYAIKVSVKQIAEIRIGAKKEKLKSQVALLESTRGCPVKKHDTFVYSYSVVPKVMAQETHHVAQEMKLNMADASKLAASTRLTHSKMDEGSGVSITYYLNVHAVVAMGADLITKIPFTISYPEPVKAAPKETKPRSESQSASQAPAVQKEPEVDLLIDFDSDPLPTQPALIPGPGMAGGMPTGEANGIDAAIAMVRATDRELLRAQSLAANGQLEMFPTSSSEGVGADVPRFVLGTKQAGSTIGRLLADASQLRPGDASTAVVVIGSAIASASALRSLADTAVAIAKSVTDDTAQQDMFISVHDILAKGALMLESAKAQMSAPLNERRSELSSLGEYLSQAFPALINALPGPRECVYACDTIATCTSHLDSTFKIPTKGDLAAAVDALHYHAQALSEAFKAVGQAALGPTAMSQLAQAARSYEAAIPKVIGCGQNVIIALPDVDQRKQLISLLKAVAQTSINLLNVAKATIIEPSAENRQHLEVSGSAVVESMRAILGITHHLKQTAASPAAKPATAVPDALQRIKSQPARRDSFEEFIQIRQGGAVPSLPPVSEGSNELSKQYAEADAKLANAKKKVDLVRKGLIDSRNKPRRRSIIVNQPILPGQTTVLDTMLPIVNSVSNLIGHARRRVNELGLLGQAFHAANTEHLRKDKSWAEGLAKSSMDLSSTIATLVLTADNVSNGEEEVSALVQAAQDVASSAADLVNASQVQESVNSDSQHDVEVASRSVQQAADNLASSVDAAVRIRAQEKATPGAAVSAPELERELTAMKLEEEVNNTQRKKFAARRGSAWEY
eukprot:Opistho-2@10858